jgi:hypothetical protein
LELDHRKIVESDADYFRAIYKKSEIKYLFCTRKYTDTISDMRTIQFREAICEAMSEEM